MNTHSLVQKITSSSSKKILNSTLLNSMSWNEFFRRRSRLRLLKRAGGVVSTFAALTAEGIIVNLPIFDPTQTVYGLDPLVLFGMINLAGILGSYVVGSALTSGIWRLLNKSKAVSLDQKQHDFYSRITKYRMNIPPDPTKMDFKFDYYGEKIHSVADYRDWYRRQQQIRASKLIKM